MNKLFRYCLIFLTLFSSFRIFGLSEFTNFIFKANQLILDERIKVLSIEEEEPWYVIKGSFQGDKALIINTGASLMESDLLREFRFSDVIPIAHRQSFEILFAPSNKKNKKKVLEIQTKFFKLDGKKTFIISGTCKKNGKDVELTNGFTPKMTAACKKGKWRTSFSLSNYPYNLLPLKAEQKIGFSDSLTDYRSILIGK